MHNRQDLKKKCQTSYLTETVYVGGFIQTGKTIIKVRMVNVKGHNL